MFDWFKPKPPVFCINCKHHSTVENSLGACLVNPLKTYQNHTTGELYTYRKVEYCARNLKMDCKQYTPKN